MLKNIVKLIVGILLLWAIWIGFQYQTKRQTAKSLADKKAEEFYATDLNLLLEKVGKGYEQETTVADGNEFWISRKFEKKSENKIEMTGRIDYIEVLPFTDFRLGNNFDYILTLKIKVD